MSRAKDLLTVGSSCGPEGPNRVLPPGRSLGPSPRTCGKALGDLACLPRRPRAGPAGPTALSEPGLLHSLWSPLVLAGLEPSSGPESSRVSSGSASAVPPPPRGASKQGCRACAPPAATAGCPQRLPSGSSACWDTESLSAAGYGRSWVPDGTTNPRRLHASTIPVGDASVCWEL